MRRLASLRFILTITTIIFAAFILLTRIPPSPESLQIPTSTPRQENQSAFAAGQCVHTTRATYLRFGPGLDYPVITNIPSRPQPAIHIIADPQRGLICAQAGVCNPRDEGWWWPVQVSWPDNGDVDRGWLWQGEIKPCLSG